MFPPGFVTTRYLTKPIELPTDGFVLPKETNVIVPIWAIQRHEENFPNPNDFRPDRWAAKQLGNKSNQSTVWVERSSKMQDALSETTVPCDIAAGNDDAFFAFSAGARNCPGQKFAMQEAVIVLACLLRELKFSPVEGYMLQPERCGIVQHAKGGVPLNISLRSKERI